MPDNEIRFEWLEDAPSGNFRAEIMDAIDLASDQDRRTRITGGGKTIAWIVTAEDGERLAAMDPQLAEYRRVMAAYEAHRDPLLEAAREAEALNDPIDVITAEPELPDTLQELREPE